MNIFEDITDLKLRDVVLAAVLAVRAAMFLYTIHSFSVVYLVSALHAPLRSWGGSLVSTKTKLHSTIKSFNSDYKTITMASGWTSKYAILRDLSVAQGREVPVEIKNTVTEDEKPPTLNYTEETEEEFFENYVSNGDFSTGPDITLIQQMLDMVRENNVTDVKEVDSNTILEIKKFPIHQGSGDGLQPPEIMKESEQTKKKSKRRKNVAVASLIAAYGDNSQNEFSEIPKLLKPDNFIPDGETNSQAIQINGSLKTPEPKDIKSVVSPTFMFKKKSPNQKTADLLQPSNSSISIKSECVSPLEPIKPGSFVPSSHAGEYYKKYVERSEMQAEVKEDIWSQAERKMKEIDLKRIKESITSPRSSQESSETAVIHGVDYIRLPQHRHTLPEECTVCKVLCTDKQP